MASLWKRSKSPFWVCCYTNADGQRLKKSTKQEDRASAWAVCLSYEQAERFAKQGTLTEQSAKKILSDILERTTGEPLHNHVAGDWLDEWLAGKIATKAEDTGDRYGQVVREFKASLGPRAKLSLSHITPKDIRRYRDAELEAGKSNKTANQNVKIVSAAFNAAHRQGYIVSNPCRAMESLPEQTAERSVFTPDQIGLLVDAAEGDWKGAILLGYFTGARLSDVANMRWASIDLAQKLIVFTPSKTSRGRGGTNGAKIVTVPLHEDLERQLLKAPGVGKAFLFPSLAGRGTGGKTGLSSQFAAIMQKAGILGVVTQHTAKGRKNSSLSFHSLRHSFNSAMANAGIAQEVRQKLTGHASGAQNTTYTHLQLAPLRAAIATIPGIGPR